MQNLSYENEFDLHANELESETHPEMPIMGRLWVQLSHELNGLKGPKFAERSQGIGVLASYSIGSFAVRSPFSSCFFGSFMLLTTGANYFYFLNWSVASGPVKLL